MNLYFRFHSNSRCHSRSASYCSAVRNGGADEWEFALVKFVEADGDFDRGRILSALGCTRHVWLLNRFMLMALEESEEGVGIVRKHEVGRAFSAVASSEVGRDVAFDFVRNNWRLFTKEGRYVWQCSLYVQYIHFYFFVSLK